MPLTFHCVFMRLWLVCMQKCSYAMSVLYVIVYGIWDLQECSIIDKVRLENVLSSFTTVFYMFKSRSKSSHLWKVWCSVAFPGREDPSPKLHKKLTSVPSVIRHVSTTVWSSRTVGWWTSLLSFTALWIRSAKTSEVSEVCPLNMTTTTLYLNPRERKQD